MKLHSSRVLVGIAALASASGICAAQSGGSVTPYGCGSAPAGSLVHQAGAPVPGNTLTFGVDNPAGTQTPGSLALLSMTLAPDPAYPCGTPIAGWGMTGPTGELLLSLASPSLTLGPKSWPGAGTPADFALAIPNAPILFGKHLFFQGVIIDPVGDPLLGLTEGLDVQLASALQPDLAIRSSWVEPIPVAPGEKVRLHVLVENRGTAGATGIELETCFGPGPCATTTLPIPSLAPGAMHEVVLPFMTDSSWMQSNPHFASATADPTDKIAESDEGNNQGAPAKPGFVVPIQYVPPSQPVEHDDVIVLKDGVKLSHVTTTYPNGAPSVNQQLQDPDKGLPHPVTGAVETPPGSVPDQPRIAPEVIAEDQAAQVGELVELLIKYHHGIAMPTLPPLPSKLGRFAPANISVLEQRMGRFEATRRLRRQAAASLVQSIEQAGGEVDQHFTLAGAMLARVPKGYLAVLDQNPQVEHVEAIEQAKLSGTTSTARSLMQTDPYYNAGATGSGYIAVLDSGVRATHDLLDNPDHILFTEDCVSGGAACNDTGSSAYDPTFDEADHGTAVIGIITGNSNFGNSYRGFTSSWVDSWKVSPTGQGGAVSGTAVLKAFDEAVFWGDQIVNCSFGGNNGPSGTTAQAADDAFDAGCVVICANGNDGGGSGTVDSPANAHKVLGVGCYDVDSLADQSYQSDGPTSDSRYKPDLQAPTNSWTSRATSDTALGSFGGTSSATPTVVGTASVWSDWFGLGSVTQANAGKIYAALINSGPREWGEFNNTRGVGAIELPLNGTVYMGSRNVGPWDNDSVTINVPAGASKIACAIWWPEDESQSHRDIDLYLEKPNGTTSDSSISGVSVFEHLDVNSPITSGNRDVRLYGYSVPLFTTQTVYYAIFVLD